MTSTATTPERPALRIEDLDGRSTCSVKEAAEILGIHSWSAYEAVKRGEIPALHFGKRILVPVARLRALLGADA